MSMQPQRFPATLSHRAKVEMAELLSEGHDLPYIDGLLVDLNQMLQAARHTETSIPPENLSPEETAAAIEEYVDSVGTLLAE